MMIGLHVSADGKSPPVCGHTPRGRASPPRATLGKVIAVVCGGDDRHRASRTASLRSDGSLVSVGALGAPSYLSYQMQPGGEHGLLYQRAAALILLGWALARTGEVGEGTRQLVEGLGGWNQLGARIYLPHGICRCIEEAMTTVEKTKEWCEAEILRAK